MRPQDEGEIARLVDELRSDGYTVLPWRLSQGACNETIALTRAGRLVPLDGPYVNRVVSMSAHHKSLVLSVPVSDALSLPAVQHIVSDPNLYAVASRYLREPTVIGGRPFLRWTLPSALDDSEFKRHQAGYFHQDFDALSSVRLFVYLTDVGPQDAPLVLIPGSHRAGRARRALQSAWRRGKQPGVRDVATNFQGGDISLVTGSAGTMVMMDSLTFHSASQSSARERLCLTTLYAATGFTIGSINGAVAVKPVCPRFGKLASSNDPAAIELKSLRNQSNSERHDDSGDTATCGCTSCAVPLTEVINQSGLALKRGE